MNIKIVKMEKILICFFFIILCACNEKQRQFEDESYKVLSVLYNRLAVQLPIPPMPPSSRNISKADSLKNIEKIIEFTKLRDSIQQIVAIDPYLSLLILDHFNYSKVKDEFQGLVAELSLLEEKKSLDIHRIKTSRKDSIIELNDSLLDPMVSDYLKFNKLISFSRVAFNEKFTKVVLVASAGTSGRAGFSALYFLRKIDGQWVIIDSTGISIS